MYNRIYNNIHMSSDYVQYMFSLFIRSSITVCLAIKANEPDSVSMQGWKGTGTPVAPAAMLLLCSCLLLPDQVVSDFDLFSGFTLRKVPVHSGMRTAAELNVHWQRGTYFPSSQSGLLMPAHACWSDSTWTTSVPESGRLRGRKSSLIAANLSLTATSWG